MIFLKFLRFQGVYDITDFVESHPGGDKIYLAAGGAADPFWNIYEQHKTPEILEMLEEYRIGNLDPKDIVAVDEIKVSFFTFYSHNVDHFLFS